MSFNRTLQVFWTGFIACLLLISCSGSAAKRIEANKAAISKVTIGSPQTPPLRVKVIVRGTLTNGCERLEEAKQRREGQTFFITLTKVQETSTGAACGGASKFQKEIILEVQGLEDGVYTVGVNGVTNTFELKNGGVFVNGGYASLATVDAQVLVASPETARVSVGVFVEGMFGDPCVDLRGVEQVREGNTFKLTLDTPVRIDVACLPVNEFFRELTVLETQNLPSGTYQVEVKGTDTVSTSFELRSGATYQEAKVTALEVVPVKTKSFSANVLVRGELQSSCEVIDGAVQTQSGTDRDILPDNEFIISLISRTEGVCGNETLSFKETIPIAAYGSGTYTVNVNGVLKSFTFPGAEISTRP